MGAESRDHEGTHAQAVFLSYASQDLEAARKICDALREAGVEVWFDQSELRGGEVWDQSIRRHIKTCALFIPVISQHTRVRDEGYFRLEWKLAIDRSHLMAPNKPFVLPVAIDDTRDDDEGVPERFREYQWTRLAEGRGLPAFARRVTSLLSADTLPITEAQPGLHHGGAVAAAGSSGAAARTVPRALWAVLGLLIVAVGYLAAERFNLPGRTHPASTVTASAPRTTATNSIAVLPFADMSEKKDQEYFSDGLAEELLDLLAKTPGLHVIARTSSFYFKGRQATIPEIARTLGVANVLEGSVRKSGTRLRITTQLVRADTGEHLWSETYDRDQQDVFKVQDDIARAVVENLRVALLGGANASRSEASAGDAQVHNLYLQGRYLVSSDTAEDLLNAASYFQQALQQDAGYAPAWAGLALVATRQIANSYVPVPAGIDRLSSAAQKAVDLEPNYAEGHVVLAIAREVKSFDWSGARQALDQALQLEPSNTHAQFVSAHLTMTVGSAAESIDSYRRLLERDPLNLLERRYLARALFYSDRLDEAETTIRQVLQVNPNFPAAHYELGRILLARGQVKQAVSEFESEKSTWDKLGRPLGYHAAGRTAEANAALKYMVDTSSGAEFQVAETYAFFGNKDQAFIWLDAAIERRDPGLQWLRGDPLLRSLTKDPRYAALLRRLNLPA